MLLHKKVKLSNLTLSRKYQSYYTSVVYLFMSAQERPARGEEGEEASYRGELGKGG